MGMRENSVSICLSLKTVIVLFYSYRFTGLWEESEVPTSTFLTLIVFEGFGRSRKYPHESASKLLVHAAFVFELARRPGWIVLGCSTTLLLEMPRFGSWLDCAAL